VSAAAGEGIVEVLVGGWEHSCCGRAVERGQQVVFDCIPDAAGRGWWETHHDTPAERRVSGRVVAIGIRHPDGPVEQILRLPSGRALRGFDDSDDGRLVSPQTGERVACDSEEFIVTVATPLPAA
jgi:hypothetical protein